MGVNALVDLAARQLAADLKAAPGRARDGVLAEARAARCHTIADLRAMAKRTVPEADLRLRLTARRGTR